MELIYEKPEKIIIPNTSNNREFYLKYLRDYARKSYYNNPTLANEARKKRYHYRNECKRLNSILLDF